MKHSNSLYTLEDELFPEPRKRKGSGWWKWALATILGLLFVYRSTRPVMRLRADPPPSFYDYSRSLNKEERQHQRRLAEAYWNVAVHRIQAHYSPNRPLPENPPPQFRIGQAEKSMEADVATSRVHYWFGLREVWSERDAWNASYGWNTDWVENAINSTPQYMPQWVSNLFQGLINFFSDLAQKIP